MKPPLKGLSILWVGKMSSTFARLSKILKEAGAIVVHPDPPRPDTGNLVIVDLGSVDLADKQLILILSRKPLLLVHSEVAIGPECLTKLNFREWNVVGLVTCALSADAQLIINLVLPVVPAPAQPQPQPSARPAKKPRAKTLRRRTKQTTHKHTRSG